MTLCAHHHGQVTDALNASGLTTVGSDTLDRFAMNICEFETGGGWTLDTFEPYVAVYLHVFRRARIVAALNGDHPNLEPDPDGPPLCGVCYVAERGWDDDTEKWADEAARWAVRVWKEMQP